MIQERSDYSLKQTKLLQNRLFEGFELQFDYFDLNKSYEEILKEQKNRVSSIKSYIDSENKKSKVFSLCGVHPKTYTLGRSVDDKIYEELKGASTSYAVSSVSRGGKLMYHGPGQLSLYFIFNLKDFFSGPREYTEYLFKSVKAYFLREYDIELELKSQGLWLNNKKVCFMGIRIKNGIVYHGLSINYYVDLKPFVNRPPCNVSGDSVGNIFSSPLAALFLKDEACKITKDVFNQNHIA